MGAWKSRGLRYSEEAGHGVTREVRVAGAGLEDVNGVYTLAREFAGAEMFEKDGGGSPLGKVYIRRQAEGMPGDWVITLSADADSVRSEHLYRRTEVRKEQVFPPLLGWKPCTAADGVLERHVDQLSKGLPKLEYHNVMAERGRGLMSPLEEWDQQDTSSSLEVCVVGASNIPDSYASKLHCTFQVPGKDEIMESGAVANSTDPVWRFKAPLKSWRHPDPLQFTVFANSNIKIGETTLDYTAFRETGFVGKLPLSLFGSDDPNATVNVCVTRPGQLIPGVDVVLKKELDAKIGIEVAIESKTSLSIVKIAEGGLIDRWNGDHPEQRIHLRDIITEIDGTRGTCYDLLSRLAVQDEPRTIQIKVQRASRVEA
ncbi:unnamed protein product [Prorocentrum cordatum]|uniref:PDZ domain-containing protein n=1 Tax=Prorocentrum cordatum TaxID=2364126 RepID=A0ABN9R601_9DINO|nr:unnamed protein product [Polarella glacialis]